MVDGARHAAAGDLGERLTQANSQHTPVTNARAHCEPELRPVKCHRQSISVVQLGAFVSARGASAIWLRSLHGHLSALSDAFEIAQLNSATQDQSVGYTRRAP